MNELPQDIKDLFYKAKPTTEEKLNALKKAAEALDNDPEFVKEYHRDLKEELKFQALDKNGDEMVEDDSVMHENKQYKIAYMKFCSDLMDEYVMLTLEDSDGNMKEAVDSDVILVQNH